MPSDEMKGIPQKKQKVIEDSASEDTTEEADDEEKKPKKVVAKKKKKVKGSKRGSKGGEGGSKRGRKPQQAPQQQNGVWFSADAWKEFKQRMQEQMHDALQSNMSRFGQEREDPEKAAEDPLMWVMNGTLEHLKKFQSAYFLWSKDERKKNPAGTKSTASNLGQRWTLVSKEEKDRYKETEQRLKKEYLEQQKDATKMRRSEWEELKKQQGKGGGAGEEKKVAIVVEDKDVKRKTKDGGDDVAEKKKEGAAGKKKQRR